MGRIKLVLSVVQATNKAKPHKAGQIVIPSAGGVVTASSGKGKSHNVVGVIPGMNGGVDTRPRSGGQSVGSVDRQIGATLGSIGGVVPTASSLWRKAGL